MSANPTIVVTWEPKSNPFYGAFAVVDVLASKPIRVKGAGFEPKAKIKLTICEKDEVIGEASANACGAFETIAILPALLPGVVSVKALVKGKIQAAWPLDIVRKMPKPPKL